MSVWLKVTLIVLGAMLISIGISLIPAANLTWSSQPPPSIARMFRNEPLIDALFVRPPQAAVDACLGPAGGGSFTHDDFVGLARCLHRKGFVDAQTVAAVERSDLPGPRVTELKAKTTGATWWWLLTWGVALASIAAVVYRHLRRRPPAQPQPG